MCRKTVCVLCLLLGMGLSLAAQTHLSVSLESPVYRVLEQAESRGLCAPLLGSKPYSRAYVVSVINEVLAADGTRVGFLTARERGTLKNFLQVYDKNTITGRDKQRGGYFFDNSTEKLRMTTDITFQLDSTLSAAASSLPDNSAVSTENWFTGFVNGDFGRYFSYKFSLGVGGMYIPRNKLGTYNTYYDDFLINSDPEGRINQKVAAYSQPLTHFPYTYKKRWDSFVMGELSTSGMEGWPDKFSPGYHMTGEMAVSLFDNRLFLRGGRMDREWGAMVPGSSLILNQAAQPFLAMELSAKPLNWLQFSSLTGVLEYDLADKGLKEAAETFQNAFSIGMVEVHYKNYFHLDFGTTAVWPKRFELGYAFPLIDNFLYQNDVGDFDNMSAFFNVKAQYPGIAKVWFSFYLDEINVLEKNVLEKDRAMFAWQMGTSVQVPHLPFSSIQLRYTKLEPYVYTHTRDLMPWYGSHPMETAYVNNGRSLGYYLPPNSDELLLRFETTPSVSTLWHFQYQMIRHGAEYGRSAVDGSSLLSELDPDGRATKDVLRKAFLHDGAYQWMHVFKVGTEYRFARAPVRLFAEAGVVISYFTNIPDPGTGTVNPYANFGGKAGEGTSHNYKIIDTPEYPKANSFIAAVGVRIFP